MIKKPSATLRAIPRAEWTPIVGRVFAVVGPHHVVCCAPGADIASDAQDAAELARRYNAFPMLVDALKRVIATRDTRHATEALTGVLTRLTL